MHAVAVRLRDEGSSNHVIATALGIDDDQVDALLVVADAKLRNLEASDAAS